MRITNRLITEKTISNLSDNLDRLFRLQQKVASQKQYLSASENPSAAVMGVQLRSNIKTIEAYQDTAVSTRDWMSASELSMQQLSDLNLNGISLVTKGLNDALGPDERKIIAEELNGMLKQAVSLGNSKHQNRYIFSGTATRTEPFSIDTSGAVDAVQFDGNMAIINREIAPGEQIDVNINAPSAITPFLESLIEARDALLANDMITLRTNLDHIQAAHENITTIITDIGSRIRNVEASNDRMEQTKVEIKALASQIEDADMTEIISLLQNQETIYKAVLQVSSMTQNKLGLFDLLR